MTDSIAGSGQNSHIQPSNPEMVDVTIKYSDGSKSHETSTTPTSLNGNAATLVSAESLQLSEEVATNQADASVLENSVPQSLQNGDEKDRHLRELALAIRKVSTQGDEPTSLEHTGTFSIQTQAEERKSGAPLCQTQMSPTRLDRLGTTDRCQTTPGEDACLHCEKEAVSSIKRLAADSSGVIAYLEKLERTIQDLQAQLKSPDQIQRAEGEASTQETKDQETKDQETKDQETKDQETKDQETKDQVTQDQETKDRETKETSSTAEEKYILDIKWMKVRIYRFAEADSSDEDTSRIPGDKSALSSKYVLTVYRHFNVESNVTIAYFLEIKSEPILRVMREIVKYYPGVSLEGNFITLEEPYCLLFHHQRQLVEYLKKECIDDITKQHLELLLTFMKERTGSSAEEIETFFHPNNNNKIVSFKNSWVVFPPGSIVYSHQDNQPQAYVVERVNVSRFESAIESWDLRCWFIDYDGTNFGKVYTSLSLYPYDGFKKVTSLEITPADYLPKGENDSIREKLIKRGQRFWDFQGFHHQEYIGDTWIKTSADESVRVIIDHAFHQRKNPKVVMLNHNRSTSSTKRAKGNANHPEECLCETCYRKKKFKTRQSFQSSLPSSTDKYARIEPNSKPDDLTLLLCPCRVFGYALRYKEWRELNISQLRDVQFGLRGFDKLVLERKYKTIVQALVKSYVEKKSDFKDLVDGKGKGLVALLHGAPGTGKTLTAECVAEHFKRPLYMVTCGDIGVSPPEVEENLGMIFEYAHRWKAVLLLDEADIFLQERNYHDLTRNAIVSIFLRMLEYFDGILFLTTNRVGQFDEAFRSRLHLTLNLPHLSRSSQQKILYIFINDLKLSKEDKDELIERVEPMIKDDHLNGRQIRNTVRTAIALAEQKKEPLNAEHFDDVLQMTRDFTTYIAKLKRVDPDRLANLHGNR